MGFRNYDPGLNRFLTRDAYGGAMADMSLATDVFTGNRYAFAGGNPISFVELDGHLFGMSWSDIGHAALDVAGMVPVIGEVADVANGIWYAAEGNYVDAAMSLASAIPLAGNAVAAAKLAKTGKKIADGIDTARDIEKAAENAKSIEKGVEGATDLNKAAPTNTPKPKVDEPTAPKQNGPSCKTNSFVPGTKVLMADGSTKAIEDLQLGDQVHATDVESGAGQSRTVTNVRSHAGVKKLITFTVDVDGKDGSKTASITSTDAHLVWLPDVGMWAKAGQLKPGMWLQTAAGTWVQVTAVKQTTHQERVHNLTVNGVHTYYVLAGSTPVLVHNCGDDLKYVTYTKTHPETGVVYTGRTSGYGDPEAIVRARDAGHHMNKEGFGPAVLDKYLYANKPRSQRHSDMAYQAIRGREQNLIDYHGGAQSAGGTSGNAIRGISEDEPLRGRYMHAARRIFGLL